MTRDERLAAIARLAVQAECETQVPARLIVAAWAQESSWGKRIIGKCNCFGIKAASRHSLTTDVWTHEFLNGRRFEGKYKFADYESPAAAVADYCWLLSNGKPYAKAWQAFTGSASPDRADQLIRDIAEVYATDPNYAARLLAISRQANVAGAINAAVQVLRRS